MEEKRSLREIITGNLVGIWSDNLEFVITVENDNLEIEPLYTNLEGRSIREPVVLMLDYEEYYTRVVVTDYETAVNEFETNSRMIKSPKVYFSTISGRSNLPFGGYVFTKSEDEEVVVDGDIWPTYDCFEDPELQRHISNLEKKGKWCVLGMVEPGFERF